MLLDCVDDGPISELLLAETGMVDGVLAPFDRAKVLFDMAEANEIEVGRKNGKVVPFDLIAICCCDCDVVGGCFIPVKLIL